MTYANLFSKLLKEDLKRRTWAVALTFLAFFFSLPIGLALAMENAENTSYRMFNDYRPFINDGTMPQDQFMEKLLSLRTDVVMGQAGFGNGMAPFLMVLMAVIIGVSSFSYLHNKQKVDFYHSIPVRREVLFCSQFAGGILMVGLTYGINLLLMTVVALAYKVPLGSIAGPLAGSWALNLLFFMLMYTTVVIAMLMTGNMVVGILASGIFFFFLPGMMLLLTAYCETFFITTARYMWSSEYSPFLWGIKYLSPFSIYMVALTSWELKELGSHVPELFCFAAALPALTLLALQLYRMRPSEASGRAMAFKRSKSPIRMIMVTGFGLGGGIFFWVLQSKLRWGLFGVIVSVILAHCIIEIIYHFDFKKLFSNRLQLGIALVITVLLFLSFRFDWYGYDAYIPGESKVASVSLDVESEHQWTQQQSFEVRDDGTLIMLYPAMFEYIEENMKLTDMDAVMAIVKESRDRTLAFRESRLERVNENEFFYPRAVSYSVIGGADGPTSVFIAGKGEKEPAEEEKFFTTLTVCYELKDGRKVRREYPNIPLSAVMDAYDAIYSSQEYKTGLYNIFGQNPAEICQALYREGDRTESAGEDRGKLEEILAAYQADLMDLDVDARFQELPVGTIGFVTDNTVRYAQQEIDAERVMNGRGGYDYVEVNRQFIPADYVYFWPVYPSFTRTLGLLKEQGIEPGSYLVPEQVEAVRINVPYFFQNTENGGRGELPRGEELEALQRLNPRYLEEGYLEIRDPGEIETVMKAVSQEESFGLNCLYAPPRKLLNEMYANVELANGRMIDCRFNGKNVTPELLKLFEGIPVEDIGNSAE